MVRQGCRGTLLLEEGQPGLYGSYSVQGHPAKEASGDEISLPRQNSFILIYTKAPNGLMIALGTTKGGEHRRAE